MKTITSLLTFAAFAHFGNATVLQDSTIQISDSTKTQSIVLGASQRTTSSMLLPYSTVSLRSGTALSDNAGVNLLNALRGQQGNVFTSPNAFYPELSVRGGNVLYAIDGMPNSYGINNNTNFNAFEYQSADLIMSRNGALLYGGGGLGSVLSLTSKNGEGYDQAHFELNSYTTGAQQTSGAFNETSNKSDYWRFTNALAYSQDFGAIDTRVSYAFTSMPVEDDLNTKNRLHSLRINTGLNLSDVFKARVILDSYDSKTRFGREPSVDDGEDKTQTLQARLTLTYQPVAWFNLTSQSSIARIKDNYEYLNSFWNGLGEIETKTTYKEHQQRKFANLFANFSPHISKNIIWNSSIGYQIDKFDPSMRYRYSQRSSDGAMSESGSDFYPVIDTKSLLLSSGLNVNDVLLFDITYRHDEITETNNDSYGATAAFVFTKAFGWGNARSGSGKLRVNYGKADIIQNTNFPYNFSDAAGQVFPYYSTEYLATGGTNFEIGTDLRFLKNRMGVSLTTFRFEQESTFGFVYLPWGPNGAQLQLVDFGSTRNTGWELMLDAAIVKTQNLQYDAKLSWSNLKQKIGESGGDGYAVMTPYLPKWRMGLLQSLSIQNFSLACLVDFQHGGVYYEDMGVVPFKASYIKVRDISAGYNFHIGALQRIGVNNLRLSLIGRNLIMIDKDEKGQDPDARAYSSTHLKSVSFGATFTF